MIIAYTLLFVLSMTFRMLHWPGGSLFLVISPVLPLIDILIQALRKKEDKLFRSLSSLAVFGIAFYLTFKLLSWPGSFTVFLFAVLCMVPILVLTLKKGLASFRGYRKPLLAFFIAFSVYTIVIRPSQLQLTFMLEDPFNKNELVPPFIRQILAFKLYQEGEPKKAERLLLIAIDETSRNKEQTTDALYREMYYSNLQQLEADLLECRNGNWTHYHQLVVF